MGRVKVYITKELFEAATSLPSEWPWPEGTEVLGWKPSQHNDLVEVDLQHPDLEDGEHVTPTVITPTIGDTFIRWDVR